MRYIMALDGGGTKLNCMIADENGRLVGKSKGGPTNPNYSSRNLIEESIRSAIETAVQEGNVNVNDIYVVNSAMINAAEWVVDTIKSILYPGVRLNFLSEFDVSIYGAIQEDFGALALSGTGSFASVRTEKERFTVGGWGDALGDEGSGYYIGHKALEACAQMEDGILEYTLIKQYVQEKYNIDTMKKIVSELSNAPCGHQRTIIASLCPIVGRCADEGDKVAVDIIKNAARLLAVQLITVIKKCGRSDIPVTVSGGAWKATPLFFSSFLDAVKQEFHSIDIRRPIFEPVIGGILLGLRDLGFPIKENMDLLKSEFSSFVYHKELFI